MHGCARMDLCDAVCVLIDLCMHEFLYIRMPCVYACVCVCMCVHVCECMHVFTLVCECVYSMCIVLCACALGVGMYDCV